MLPHSTGEIRNPKAETRKKAEVRRPKKAPERSPTLRFGFRISAFGFLSAFGFRISDLKREGKLLLQRLLAVALKQELRERFEAGCFSAEGLQRSEGFISEPRGYFAGLLQADD